jgi:hypothetical protein
MFEIQLQCAVAIMLLRSNTAEQHGLPCCAFSFVRALPAARARFGSTAWFVADRQQPAEAVCSNLDLSLAKPLSRLGFFCL